MTHTKETDKMTDKNVAEKSMNDKLTEGLMLGNGYIVKSYGKNAVQLYRIDEFSNEVESLYLIEDVAKKLLKVFQYLENSELEYEKAWRNQKADIAEKALNEALNNKEANDGF